MTDRELSGKVAVVTGAGRNIGRAIALALAEAGAAVVVNVRSNRSEAESVVGEIEKAGGKGVAVVGDVGAEKTAAALADAALKTFGRVDILVNNAALRREKNIAELSFDEWREVMNVILDGTFRCIHACLPALRKSGGTIINIGGMSAHIGSKDRAHVMAAKAALVGLSRGLAHDLAADRITANCVVPGAIDTTRPATSQNPAHHLTHGTITGERGRPADVAAMVRFLCGPNARYITGQTIHVSGGAYLGS
ncbi:MAG TPA: SDR family oxidoreductase [Pseudolabrys sp.]|nr:SDR family oxidoreductase [Pseudolabrys sp.]